MRGNKFIELGYQLPPVVGLSETKVFSLDFYVNSLLAYTRIGLDSSYVLVSSHKISLEKRMRFDVHAKM